MRAHNLAEDCLHSTRVGSIACINMDSVILLKLCLIIFNSYSIIIIIIISSARSVSVANTISNGILRRFVPIVFTISQE
jgi:hypothetical protein